MKFTLEGHKLFPYIAWVTIIGFALFVFHMTTSLSDNFGRLEAQTNYTEESLNP